MRYADFLPRSLFPHNDNFCPSPGRNQPQPDIVVAVIGKVLVAEDITVVVRDVLQLIKYL